MYFNNFYTMILETYFFPLTVGDYWYKIELYKHKLGNSYTLFRNLMKKYNKPRA